MSVGSLAFFATWRYRLVVGWTGNDLRWRLNVPLTQPSPRFGGHVQCFDQAALNEEVFVCNAAGYKGEWKSPILTGQLVPPVCLLIIQGKNRFPKLGETSPRSLRIARLDLLSKTTQSLFGHAKNSALEAALRFFVLDALAFFQASANPCASVGAALARFEKIGPIMAALSSV
jgi:hypothetical protein